jgi:activator of HSP90 ATPase
MRPPLIIVALCSALLLSACSESGVSGVNSLLNARDASINNRDITTYSELIADDYLGRQRGKAEIVQDMQKMFDQFSQIEMESFGRDIYIVDDTHARAAQSYRMKVSMDGSKREMLQREELSLTHTDSGWKISSGL